jgi:hypothetical protein
MWLLQQNLIVSTLCSCKPECMFVPQKQLQINQKVASETTKLTKELGLTQNIRLGWKDWTIKTCKLFSVKKV